MSLKYARWQDGTWYMNPFGLTCEQVKELVEISKAHEIRVDEFSVRYYYRYNWGHIFEEERFADKFHEIDITYSCPSGYGREKQMKWLEKHGYPFNLRGGEI